MGCSGDWSDLLEQQITKLLPMRCHSASEDPPAPASRGEAERAPDDHADGGIGFPLELTP
ncbi:hypothetical protein SynA1560_02441 [Synechococcus sp. A15-60]|nr:hypothetical protein SynA1560_02441 [Synechococcus sp. A15-60]